jgi:hypothetical protein
LRHVPRRGCGLHALLRAEVLGDAQIAVDFDAPGRPWITAVAAKGPTVNVFLYDVRENVARREVMFERVLDDDGQVIARRTPARRYDLYYVLSVWAPTIALEHQIVAALTAGLGAHDVFPVEHLPPSLTDRGHVFLGLAGGMKRGMLPSFAGETKLQLELVVTIPLPSRVDLPAAPPVDRPMDLRVSGNEQRESVSGRPPSVPAQRPAQGAAVPPGQPGAQPRRTREQLALRLRLAAVLPVRPAGATSRQRARRASCRSAGGCAGRSDGAGAGCDEPGSAGAGGARPGAGAARPAPRRRCPAAGSRGRGRAARRGAAPTTSAVSAVRAVAGSRTSAATSGRRAGRVRAVVAAGAWRRRVRPASSARHPVAGPAGGPGGGRPDRSVARRAPGRRSPA